MIFRPSPKGSEAPRSVAGEGHIASPDPHFHWEEALRKMSRVLGGTLLIQNTQCQLGLGLSLTPISGVDPPSEDRTPALWRTLFLEISLCPPPHPKAL